jgi:hypothetical protein
MPFKKIRVKRRGIALEVTRAAIQEDRLVYVAVSNQPIRYKKFSSRIVYIGSTKKGIYRIGVSAAARAHILEERGVKKLTFHILCCNGSQSISMWKVLEAGLLDTFKDMYEEYPIGNKKAPNIKEVKTSHKKLNQIILKKRLEELSSFQ